MSQSPHVLVVLRTNRQLPPRLVELVGDRAQLHWVVTPDELTADSRNAEAMFVWDFRSTFLPDTISELRNLRWVHVAAVGVDASMSSEVRRSGLTMTNSSGVTASAMAEYALGLMLMAAKGLKATLRDQGLRAWNPRETGMLEGRTLLLFGIGAVNRRLAQVTKALGMRVIGVGRHSRPAHGGFDSIIGSHDMDTALPEVDYLVLAAPATPQTSGILGERQFDLLKPSAVVVNVGRGALVDQGALIAALQSGKIGAAALDVFEEEPLRSDSPLWNMEQVIISPHMSADFAGWQEAMVMRFVENLNRWLQGSELLSVVDLDLGYAPMRGAGR